MRGDDYLMRPLMHLLSLITFNSPGSFYRAANEKSGREVNEHSSLQAVSETELST